MILHDLPSYFHVWYDFETRIGGSQRGRLEGARKCVEIPRASAKNGGKTQNTAIERFDDTTMKQK